jgi:prepilin-type N-terminal cleavage/methylation domain-containing protein
MQRENKNKTSKFTTGFTLIELLVAISLFAIVVTISLNSITGAFNAGQKSRSLRSVMDNLNITLEGMTRTIRFGTNYHCGTTGDTTKPLDCGEPGNSTLTVKAVDGTQVKFSLVGGRIMRSINNGTDFPLTSSDITITKLAFRVYGSPAYSTPDFFQPQVVIVISGYVGTKTATQSAFTLETTTSQRTLDFP